MKSRTRRLLEIFALWGLVVAPTFDLLGHNPTFFAAHQTSRSGFIAFGLLTLTAPPLVAWSVGCAVSAISPRIGNVVHVATVSSLVAFAVVPMFSRPHRLSGELWAVSLVAIAAVAAFLYVKISSVRRLIGLLAFAPVVLLVALWFVSPTRAFLLGPPAHARVAVEKRAPVVMLVFDGLSLPAIQRPDGTIDARRFPNLADLARSSTWYANATTSATRTSVAIPALTAGVLPDGPGRSPPVASSYPRSIFTLFGDEPLNVEEIVTHLCHRCANRLAPKGWRYLTIDGAIVLLHTVLPVHVAARSLPAIGFKWAGLLPGAYEPPGEIERFHAFLRKLKDADLPLHYLHLNLPHEPWEYLDTLQRYGGGDVTGRTKEVWSTDRAHIEHGIQRYVLQTQAADRIIGDVRARLERAGTWERAVFVVAADHGFAFEPGRSSRLPDGVTAPQILRIPLFVKAPGQTDGHTDQRVAESIDLLPTIIDLLDADADWELPGASLVGRDPRRKRRLVLSDRGFDTWPADLDRGTRLSARIAELFGETKSVYGFGPHKELLGDEPDTRSTADVTGALYSPLPRTIDPDAPNVPARIGMQFDGRPPPWLAIALNGRIAGLAKPFAADRRWFATAMLSPRYFTRGENAISIYGIHENGDLATIRLR